MKKIKLIISIFYILLYLLLANLVKNFDINILTFVLVNLLTILIIDLIKNKKIGKYLLINVSYLTLYLPFIFINYFGSKNLFYDYLIYLELNISLYLVYIGVRNKQINYISTSILIILNMISTMIDTSFLKIIIVCLLAVNAIIYIIKTKTNKIEYLISISLLLIFILVNTILSLSNILVEISLYNSFIVILLLMSMFLISFLNIKNKESIIKSLYIALIIFIAYASLFYFIKELVRFNSYIGLINEYFSIFILVSSLSIIFSNNVVLILTDNKIKMALLTAILIIICVNLFEINSSNFVDNYSENDSKSNISNVVELQDKIITMSGYCEQNNGYDFVISLEVKYLISPKERFSDILLINYSDDLNIVRNDDYDVIAKFNYKEKEFNNNIVKEENILVLEDDIILNDDFIAVKLDLVSDKFNDYSGLFNENIKSSLYEDFTITLEARFKTYSQNIKAVSFNGYHFHQTKYFNIDMFNLFKNKPSLLNSKFVNCSNLLVFDSLN